MKFKFKFTKTLHDGVSFSLDGQVNRGYYVYHLCVDGNKTSYNFKIGTIFNNFDLAAAKHKLIDKWIRYKNLIGTIDN